MSEHLPILQVVLPLLAAPLCVLLRQGGLVRWFASAVAWVTFAIAVVLLRATLGGAELSYAIGDWAPPIGIEYRVNLPSAFVAAVVAAIAAVVLTFDSRGSATRLAMRRRYLFYAAYLLCLAGLLGMAISGDAFNVFVFLEISSLATYSLVSIGKERRALMSAFSYLIMGTLGGTFFLLGVGMLYVQTGTLNMADLAQRLDAVSGTRTVSLGFALIVIGLSIKLAVFPLHQWLPNAYTYAPPKAAAFLAGTATKVSYWVLVRFVFLVFGASYAFDQMRLDLLLMPLSLLAMFVGALAAAYQRDLRRLLAYSSISQVGYMTLGFSFANREGLTAGLVHMLNHGLAKSALFLAVACIAYRAGTTDISALRGIGRRMPFTSLAFVIGGMSLVGVPGTAGFITKWHLVLAAFDRGLPAVGFAVLLSSLLAVAYVWRLVETAYFSSGDDGGRAGGGSPGGEPRAAVLEAPLGMLLPMTVLMAATVVFGLWTRYSAGIAGDAAAFLLGVAP
ncbi:MAG TPA: monovalent cation/H+ antiporter subunit D family protein [Thermoanaerobaculia bacterium]|nr:monovalent cation/H+ antiporter subunit D family protein [Thermoanaerobaculia bacterium]